MKILRIGCVFGGFLSLVLSLSAQTFNSLYSFDAAEGFTPYAGLVQTTDGNLYGTTYLGGTYDIGTVFTITPKGALTWVHSFCSKGGNNCTDGAYPYAGLIQATDGNLYGTTLAGGAHNSLRGTVFTITPKGALTTLYSFCPNGDNCTDGAYPYAGLIQATDGNFYGTTNVEGANNSGTVFKITPKGALTTLYSFCSKGGNNCTDGANPYAGLIQATDGNFYGTTTGGGNYGGTVFKITPKGKLTTLHRFCSQNYYCKDGYYPYAGLIQATDGSFYGTTEGDYGKHCGSGYCGTVYKITPSGKLTTLHSFDGADGAGPSAGLVQATNGDFYGTTTGGGTNYYGTIFRITPGGKLTTLHSFDGTDGANPYAGLVQDTNGTFYGTTFYGGAYNDGTVFSLSVHLGPFVETNPTSGKVGAAVKILGTDLTGATSVTFNGTAAAFKVVSASLIKTTVPTGATTGTVEVTTPKGTLKSNVVFRVTE